MNKQTLFDSEVKCDGPAFEELAVLRMMYLDHYYLLLGHSNKIEQGYDTDDEEAPFADETIFLHLYKKGRIESKYRLHDNVLWFQKNTTN